jgi:predicted alpha/beta hydrolase
LHVVGHSVGGFVIGLAPSARKIERIFTVGAQYAYWRDYALSVRPRMFVQWHLFMPVVVRLFGYLPAKRLGWMEDTPKGVALDWAHMEPQFENVLARHGTSPEALRRRFAEVRAPMLAFATTDDHFGTPAAVDRLLEYYSGSERVHLRIEPSAIDQTAIGHFAFFSRRFRDSLWPIALDWLRAETLPTIRGTALWRAADPAPY